MATSIADTVTIAFYTNRGRSRQIYQPMIGQNVIYLIHFLRVNPKKRKIGGRDRLPWTSSAPCAPCDLRFLFQPPVAELVAVLRLPSSLACPSSLK